MSNTLTQTQLTDVIKAIINTNALLANYLYHNANTQEHNPTNTIHTKDKDKATLPKTDWSYASTTLVTKYTGEYYNWHKLVSYCKENNLPIKREILDRLELNSYPACAWQAVYGVVLGKF